MLYEGPGASTSLGGWSRHLAEASCTRNRTGDFATKTQKDEKKVMRSPANKTEHWTGNCPLEINSHVYFIC